MTPEFNWVHYRAGMRPYFAFSWQSHIKGNPQGYHCEINSDTKVTLEWDNVVRNECIKQLQFQSRDLWKGYKNHWSNLFLAKSSQSNIGLIPVNLDPMGRDVLHKPQIAINMEIKITSDFR